MRTDRILLVDDEPVILRTVARALAASGYDVVTASDGAAAIEELRAAPADVVVTDLVMDGTDGFEVLRVAKELEPDAAVVVITGYSDVESAINALRLGAEDYLAKPFEMEELLLRVSRCAAKRELRRKVRLYESILPLCAGCKQVRDDEGREPGQGEWLALEEYIRRKTGLTVSHGYCPACQKEWSEASRRA